MHAHRKKKQHRNTQNIATRKPLMSAHSIRFSKPKLMEVLLCVLETDSEDED